jgi:hypothetical protein
MTSSGLEPATFQLVAKCPNHYSTACPSAPERQIQKLHLRLNSHNGGFLAIILVVKRPTCIFCDKSLVVRQANRHIGETYNLQLQGIKDKTPLATFYASCLAYSSTLKMEAICSCETSVVSST